MGTTKNNANKIMAGARKAYGTRRDAVRFRDRPTSAADVIAIVLPASDTVVGVDGAGSAGYLESVLLQIVHCGRLHDVDSRAERRLRGDRLGETVLVGTVGDVHVGAEGEAG